VLARFSLVGETHSRRPSRDTGSPAIHSWKGVWAEQEEKQPVTSPVSLRLSSRSGSVKWSVRCSAVWPSSRCTGGTPKVLMSASTCIVAGRHYRQAPRIVPLRHDRCYDPGMFTFLRFTAIALSVLVFAVVLTVCGEAVACGGCVHACCVKTDRPDRRKDGVVADIVKAFDRLIQAVRPKSSIAMVPPLERAWSPPMTPLLASKVAQLRI